MNALPSYYIMQDNILKVLPGRLREIRQVQGLTQENVAKSMGIRQGNYALYETGARGVSLKVIPKLCRALETSPEELLGLQEGKHKRGPLSQLERRFESIKSLPAAKQRDVIKVIDALLTQYGPR